MTKAAAVAAATTALVMPRNRCQMRAEQPEVVDTENADLPEVVEGESLQAAPGI